ncbi:M23 family metallopeptidase [Dactylosporangium sp. AC04546]|uniref:M23 family metallopeptidase n=1 Tax=Dactylosporangium sp. AC04546 TaxID=2862460 RepID=UPI001EDDCA31|nr:M23 family metallopeptidase [Dactylosporangium sp. AC04546]WVK78946.1 M23 family metallopeptidase [Dactylosporangium sp. AC04546]
MNRLATLVAGTVGVFLCAPLAGVAALFGTTAASCTSPAPAPTSIGIPATAGSWDVEQLSNVARIVAVGHEKGVAWWGWVVAVATAIQESELRNLPGGDRDSIGLFQQRPSQGWGTPQQLADPTYQARKFYEALLAVEGWQQLPLAEAAQAVQRSAYPDAYARHTAVAIHLTTMIAASTGTARSATGFEPVPTDGWCGAVSAQGWTQPVNAAIVSGYRTAGRPGHQGVDLAAPRNTVVAAAAAGTITRVRCNAVDTRDGSDWGCDRDGDPKHTAGCGWYVDILHADGIVTRYCHLGRTPLVHTGEPVHAGQPLGYVGSSGHSSGPHLHFEVHHSGDGAARTAIDPEPWMRLHGAPLGQR